MLHCSKSFRFAVRRQPLITAVRFQSSSSSTKLTALEEEEKIQQELLKNKQHQQQRIDTQTGRTSKTAQQGTHPSKNSKTNAKKDTVLIKKGFSSVIKVPDTLNLEPRDILLDRLYQGYNPLLIPIKPKVKRATPKILVNIYEDLSFDDDTFGQDHDHEEDTINSLIGPKLQISKYIFDKNPQVEAKLKELDADVEEAAVKLDKSQSLFVERGTKTSKRGRVRLQYKKNMKKTDEGEDN